MNYFYVQDLLCPFDQSQMQNERSQLGLIQTLIYIVYPCQLVDQNLHTEDLFLSSNKNLNLKFFWSRILLIVYSYMRLNFMLNLPESMIIFIKVVVWLSKNQINMSCNSTICLMSIDYLKYQASSIQELLRRKLTESGVLTDQLYPGSDTKIIIDLFAWTFDALTYIVNNNVSDVLFSDTNLYQNMNRLVKLLAYKPNGYHTSQAEFQIDVNQGQSSFLQKNVVYIPKYAYIQSSLTDSNGSPVCFSFIQPYVLSLYDINNEKKVAYPISWPVLYNGKYKKYSQVFSSHGVQYDTFILNLLDLTSPSKIYVDHSLFNVFVQTVDSSNGKKKIQKWEQTQNLVLNADQDSKMFQIRLNQAKKYEIHFGDGIHGQIPPYGAYIHILYFQSNGQQGIVDVSKISSTSLHIDIEGFNDNITMFDLLFNGQTIFKKNYGDLFISNNIFSQVCTKLKFTNITKSSKPSTFQSVQSIRQNAPLSFRRGHRLVTQQDYQSYIKQNYKSIVYDVFAANNNYYMSAFYGWLDKYGRLDMRIRQQNYKFADSCDFNNVYLWFVASNMSQISSMNFKKIVSDCNKIKCATSQIVPLNAVVTKFIPFLDYFDQNSSYAYKNSGSSLIDYAQNIRIQVFKSPAAIISDQKLREFVYNQITQYFSQQNQKLGSTIQLNAIIFKLFDLGYIKSIRTVNQITPNHVNYVNGLSFGAWTTDLIDGKDFTVFQNTLQLEHFQFPKLIDYSLISKIEVINTADSVNVIEF